MNVRTSHLRYLILAAACHIALTITIFLIGHFQLLPGRVDQNGIGLTFAIDGTSYQALASEMAGEWQNNGGGAWLQTKSPLHCRLYSLTFATFGKLLGHNILAAEPLNLVYYLGTLICIYFLGRQAFNARTGLLAASIVGVWPSFLLHSTQLLRDPLSILCFLTLIFILILLLGRDFRWRQALEIGIGSALLVTLLWVVRGNMWNIVLVAILLTLAMLAYRMIRERKFMAGNTAVILIIFFVALLVPTRLESTSLPGQVVPVTPLAIPSANQPTRSEGIWTNTIKQMGQRREGFRIYKLRASDLDTDVRAVPVRQRVCSAAWKRRPSIFSTSLWPTACGVKDETRGCGYCFWWPRLV